MTIETLLRIWGERTVYGEAVNPLPTERFREPPLVDASTARTNHVDRFISRCPFDVRELWLHRYGHLADVATFRWRDPRVDRGTQIMQRRWVAFAHLPEAQMLLAIDAEARRLLEEWLKTNPVPEPVYCNYVGDGYEHIPSEFEARFLPRPKKSEKDETDESPASSVQT